ncbi:MAG: hypothetical protein HY736_18165 [Verrucomicrobia bacterium]|nr:hypothetical protein [Verrucomicrobiota bacterium]
MTGNSHPTGARRSAAQKPDADGVRFATSRVDQLETWRRPMRMLLPFLIRLLSSGEA